MFIIIGFGAYQEISFIRYLRLFREIPIRKWLYVGSLCVINEFYSKGIKYHNIIQRNNKEEEEDTKVSKEEEDTT